MFWILHIAAVLFFLPALFVTIPCHMLFGRMESKSKK